MHSLPINLKAVYFLSQNIILEVQIIKYLRVFLLQIDNSALWTIDLFYISWLSGYSAISFAQDNIYLSAKKFEKGKKYYRWSKLHTRLPTCKNRPKDLKELMVSPPPRSVRTFFFSHRDGFFF